MLICRVEKLVLLAVPPPVQVQALSPLHTFCVEYGTVTRHYPLRTCPVMHGTTMELVVQFAKADFRQRMASIYFFFFNCPWLPERVLQLSDFKMINGMFSKLPFGTRRRCAAPSVKGTPSKSSESVACMLFLSLTVVHLYMPDP